MLLFHSPSFLNQKINLHISLGKLALEKARYNNSHKESLVLALHKEQTFLSQHFAFLEMKSRMKKSTISTIHLFSTHLKM